jgi:hypothetical protein
VHRLSLFALCLALSACGDERFFAQISGGTGLNQCSNATQTRATITGIESFGFDVALRPWVDVVFPSANIDIGARYGALIELGFIGYATR